MATWSIAKNFGSNDAYTVRLDLIGAEQSVENNQTYLHFACYLVSNRSSASFTGQARTDTLTVAGMTVNPSHDYYVLHGGGSVLLWKYDMTVVHDSDGTFLDKSVSCGVLIDTTFSSSGYIGTVTADGTMTLATIPRASTIGATDANIGATSMIAVTRKSSGYTHSIAYKFGTLSGYITSSGGVSTAESKFSNTSIAFTVPTTFYAEIPNAKSGTCTLTIKTYSGTTQIGDAKTCTFTATAAEANCKPTVSGTVVDSNNTTKALTGDARKLVRYYSTALCTIAATAKNSATISSKAIGGSTVSGGTRSIPNVENGSVAFSATDSRGYSSSATVNATMVSYVKLTNNATGTRTDPTSGNAALNLNGNYYNGSFGAVDNTLEIKYRIGYGEYISVTPTISENTYSAIVPLTDLDYTQAYTVEIVVTDKLASVSKNVVIGKGVPVFDWGESDMNIHVPLRLDVPLSVSYGGTGADTAAAARNNLGITPAAIGALPTTGGVISGDLVVAGGMTLGAISNPTSVLKTLLNPTNFGYITDFNTGNAAVPGLWRVYNADGTAANAPYSGYVSGICLVVVIYNSDGTMDKAHQLFLDGLGDVYYKVYNNGVSYGAWKKLT